jgi:hypothetical protein
VAAKKKVREIPVQFVRRMELVEKKCVQCGDTFTGTKKARFCGLPCKNRWNYFHHVEARRAARREKYAAERGKK